MTTLRPRGPSVTFTASASLFTPRSSARRASSSNSSILAMNTSDHVWQAGAAHRFSCHRPGRRRGVPGRYGTAPGPNDPGRAAWILRLLLDDGEHVAGGEHQVLLAVVLDLGAAVLAVQHHVADLDVHRHALGAGVVEAARAYRKDLTLLGLLLGGVRDHQT